MHTRPPMPRQSHRHRQRQAEGDIPTHPANDCHDCRECNNLLDRPFEDTHDEKSQAFWETDYGERAQYGPIT